MNNEDKEFRLESLLTLLKNLEQGHIIQAKFPKPCSFLADFQSIPIKEGKEVLVMVKDNSVIRQREKAFAENRIQSIFFASVAHDLRTPLNSMLASNTILLK